MPLLLNEQARFAALLDSLQELSTALEAGLGPLPARLEPKRLVNELEEVLADHFQSADECLRTVAVSRHDLLPAVVDMRADHAALSASLVDLAPVVADQGRWVELPRRIADLLERLALHRESEAALVHEAAAIAKVA